MACIRSYTTPYSIVYGAGNRRLGYSHQSEHSFHSSIDLVIGNSYQKLDLYSYETSTWKVEKMYENDKNKEVCCY